MLKDLKMYVYLISLFLFSCNQYQGDLIVIRAKYENNYSYPCILNNQKQKLNISNIRKYKNGKLIEYQGCASEGLYTENFESNQYSNEDLEVKYLSIKKVQKNIIFFDKKYKIIRENIDSIYTKSVDKNEYYIFIGNIPK